MVAQSKKSLEVVFNHSEIRGKNSANSSVFLLRVVAFLQIFEQKEVFGHGYRCHLTALFQIAAVYGGDDISSYLQEEVLSNDTILVSFALPVSSTGKHQRDKGHFRSEGCYFNPLFHFYVKFCQRDGNSCSVLDHRGLE